VGISQRMMDNGSDLFNIVDKYGNVGFTGEPLEGNNAGWSMQLL